MHHNFVIIGHHTRKDDIEENIERVENLCELIYKYLPVGIKQVFESAINKCNHSTEKSRTPNLTVMCLKEMKDGIFKQKES